MRKSPRWCLETWVWAVQTWRRGQTWVEWASGYRARVGTGRARAAGLGELGSWLQDKDLGLLGIVCIGGRPSVCTSQVCLQMRSWPKRAHLCLSQPLKHRLQACVFSLLIHYSEALLTVDLGAESLPRLSLLSCVETRPCPPPGSPAIYRLRWGPLCTKGV